MSNSVLSGVVFEPLLQELSANWSGCSSSSTLDEVLVEDRPSLLLSEEENDCSSMIWLCRNVLPIASVLVIWKNSFASESSSQLALSCDPPPCLRCRVDHYGGTLVLHHCSMVSRDCPA